MLVDLLEEELIDETMINDPNHEAEQLKISEKIQWPLLVQKCKVCY